LSDGAVKMKIVRNKNPPHCIEKGWMEWDTARCFGFPERFSGADSGDTNQEENRRYVYAPEDVQSERFEGDGEA
jgi:hypothetical protein